MSYSTIVRNMSVLDISQKTWHWMWNKQLPCTGSVMILPKPRGLHCHQRMLCRRGPSGDRGPWKVLFFGSDHFSLPHLKVLHSSQKNGDVIDRLEVVLPESKFIKRRGKRRILSPVYEYCKEHGLCHHHWPLTDDPSGFHVGVIVSFGHLLPERLVSSFPMGILNVHPSLLPRWRGGAPIQHTILNGDATTGVSVMRIRPNRFDVGPLVLQREFSVAEGSSTESLSEALSEEGSKMILDILSDLRSFISKEMPQSEEGVTFARKIPSSLAWINWDSSVDEIDRLYRAISEQMPVRTLFGEEELRLEQMVPPDVCISSGVPPGSSDVPGDVLFNKHKNIICVRCRDGWVGFGAVSPVGRKRMTAREFYNGYLSGSRDTGSALFLNRHNSDR